MNRVALFAAVVLAASATATPTQARAEPTVFEGTRGSGGWQFGALVYFYYADIGTMATLPNGTASDVTIDASDLLSNSNSPS